MITEPIDRQIARFTADAQRWLKELDRFNGRGTTAYYGIMARACEHLDHIITTAAIQALSITGSASTNTVQSICGGKPIDKLTMGQCVQLLITLKPALSRALDGQSPQKASQRTFPKPLVTLLERLSRTRNDFAHGRFQPSRDHHLSTGVVATQDFLEGGLCLTAFPLFLRLANHNKTHERV